MKLWRVPQSCFILVLLACSGPDAQLDASLYQDDSNGFDAIRPGIEVLLEDSLHLVAGRNVGLITNQTGVDASGRSSIDRIHDHPSVELVALFAPEHGIRGTADPGETIGDDVDVAKSMNRNTFAPDRFCFTQLTIKRTREWLIKEVQQTSLARSEKRRNVPFAVIIRFTGVLTYRCFLK